MDYRNSVGPGDYGQKKANEVAQEEAAKKRKASEDLKKYGYDPKKINIGLNAHKVAVRQAREKTLDQISAVDENFAKKRTETTEKIAKHNETIAGNKALIKKMYSNVNKDIASQLAEFDTKKKTASKKIDEGTSKLKKLQDEIDTANAGLKALKDTKEWKNRELTETQKTEFDKYSKIIREAENQKTLLYGKFDGKKLTKEEKEAYKTVIKKINGNQNMTFEEKTQTELQEEVNKISKEEKKTQAKAKSLMSATDRKTVENKEKGVEKLRKEKVELNKVKYNIEKAAIDATGAAVNLNYEATAAMAHEKAVNMFDKEQIIKGGTDEGLIGWVSDFRNHSISEIGNAFGKTALFLYGGDTTLPDKDNSLQALEADAKILNTLAENGKSMEAGKKALTIKENGEEKTVIVDEMTNSMHEYQATNDLKRNAGFEVVKAGVMFAPGGNFAAGGVHMMQSSANYKAEQIRAGNNNPTYWSTDNAKNVVGDGLMASTYAALPFVGKAAEAGAAARGLTGIGSRVGVTGLAWGTTGTLADAGSQYAKTGKVDWVQSAKTGGITAGMGMAGRGIQAAAAANPESVLNKGAWEGTKELGTGIGKSVKSGVVKTYEGTKGIVNSAKSLPSKVYNRINNYRLNKTANAIETEMTNNGIKDYTIRKVQLENGKSGLTCDYVNTDGKVTRITRSADNKAILKETYAEGTSVYQETITAKNAREIGMEKIDNGINDFTLDEVTFGNNQTGFIRCRYINKDGKLVEELYNAVTKKPLPKNVYGKDTPAYENYIKSRTAEPVAEQPAANAGTTSEPAATGNTAEASANAPKNPATNAQNTATPKQPAKAAAAENTTSPEAAKASTQEPQKTAASEQNTASLKQTGEQVKAEPAAKPQANTNPSKVKISDDTQIIINRMKNGETQNIDGLGKVTKRANGIEIEGKYYERNGGVERIYTENTTYKPAISNPVVSELSHNTVREIIKIPKGEKITPQKLENVKANDYIQIEDLYAEGKVLEVNQYLAETKIKIISENNQVSEIHVDNQGIVRMPRVQTPAPAEISIKAGEKVPLDLQTNKTIELEFQNQKTYGKVTTIDEYLGGKNIKIESPDGTVTHIETDSIGEIISSKKIKPQKAVTIEEPIAAKTSESAPTPEVQATEPGTVATGNTATNIQNTATPKQPAEAAANAPKNPATNAQNTATPKQPKETVTSEAPAAKPEAPAAAPETKTNTKGIKEQTKEAFLETVYTSTPNKGALIINEGVRYYRDKQ